ncbi:MAG TPA: ATP-binding cassette domain-containing protein [Thermoanaerobaculia bacterium]
MLELNDVTVFRGDSATPVVEAISASVSRGSITALVGENGSGKTSLALTLAGILPRIVEGRWTGTIRFDSTSLTEKGWPAEIRSSYAASTPGVELLIGSLGDLLDATPPMIRALAAELPLGAHERSIRHLSAGQRQVAAWLFGAARRPQLLVVDEAFASLDAQTARTLVRGIKRLPWSIDMATLVVTPRDRDDEVGDCDEVIQLPAKERPPRSAHVLAIPMTATSLTPSDARIATIRVSWAANRTTRFCVENFYVHRGGVVAVRGGIGTGKTTALKTIARYPGTSGDSGVKELRKWGRAQYIGGAAYYVAGYPTILDFLSAAMAETSSAIWDLIQPKLRPATPKTDPATLSNGQRQLLAMVTALAATNAPILCLDEPERGLDAEARQIVLAVTAQRLARGACVLVASHDHEFVSQLGAHGMTFTEANVERI